MDPKKYVLITGASRGLGEATALCFRDAGWTMCLVARDESRLYALADKCGEGTQIIAADLSDPEAPASIICELKKRWPRLDALVNNAGIQGRIGPIWDSSDSDWQEVMRINLLAPVAFCRAAIPWMRDGNGGSIINLSGGGATGPRPYFSAYAASKAALVRATETLAEEARSYSVRINAVAPGALNTGMLHEVLCLSPDQVGVKEFMAAKNRALTGGDDLARAANCICWLAGHESRSITGRLISAVWDQWDLLTERAAELENTDIYTLRRIAAKDRGKTWDPS